MTPEQRARAAIDRKLAAGWVVQVARTRHCSTMARTSCNRRFHNGTAARRHRQQCNRWLPDCLQQAIIDHLEAALMAFRDVAAALPRSGP